MTAVFHASFTASKATKVVVFWSGRNFELSQCGFVKEELQSRDGLWCVECDSVAFHDFAARLTHMNQPFAPPAERGACTPLGGASIVGFGEFLSGCQIIFLQPGFGWVFYASRIEQVLVVVQQPHIKS